MIGPIVTHDGRVPPATLVEMCEHINRLEQGLANSVAIIELLIKAFDEKYPSLEGFARMEAREFLCAAQKTVVGVLKVEDDSI